MLKFVLLDRNTSTVLSLFQDSTTDPIPLPVEEQEGTDNTATVSTPYRLLSRVQSLDT